MTNSGAHTHPIVLLHGLFEAPALWNDLRDALVGQGHFAVALPLPGHRHDAAGAPETRMILSEDRLVRHVAEKIVDATGGQPARIVGHSLGGLLALLVARAVPDLVSGVMVVGAPHAGDAGHAAWYSPRRLIEIPGLSHLSVRALVPFWLANQQQFDTWIAAAAAPGERIAVSTDAMREELATGTPTAMREMAAWLYARRALPDLSDLQVPVAVMIGSEDPVVTPEHQFELVRALPNAAALILRCGHVPMLTAPDLFNRSVLGWVGQPGGWVGQPGRATPVARERELA